MGQKARQLFEENNVDVVVGAPDNTPEQLVKDYLHGNLKCGPNVCDH
jgi:predicted Fe-Mo cluster-binding NifX family protein